MISGKTVAVKMRVVGQRQHTRTGIAAKISVSALIEGNDSHSRMLHVKMRRVIRERNVKQLAHEYFPNSLMGKKRDALVLYIGIDLV